MSSRLDSTNWNTKRRTCWTTSLRGSNRDFRVDGLFRREFDGLAKLEAFGEPTHEWKQSGRAEQPSHVVQSVSIRSDHQCQGDDVHRPCDPLPDLGSAVLIGDLVAVFCA